VLQASTTEVFSYMICQSHWKINMGCQEHERGTYVMELWHILAMLCEMISITPILTNGQAQQGPLHSLQVHHIWILKIFTHWDT
jgi:hypothetical protein